MAQNAARFTKQYTDGEKRALLRSVLIDKRSVAETARMAGRGELGVAAFHISQRYAYDVVHRGREAFELSEPDALRRAIDEALVTLAAKTLRQARALAAEDHADPARLKATVQALKVAQHGLQRPKDGSPAPRVSPGASDGVERPESQVLDGLLGLAVAGNAKGPRKAGPDATDDDAG